MRSVLFFFSLSLFTSLALQGQNNETNWWYFGYAGGIEFTTGSPVPAPGSPIATSEGSSSVSDKVTGNLLFYSDGQIVYDATHNPMPNGTGLMGGSSSTQSCLIVPLPGSTTIYYVFTTSELGISSGTRYSVVDMTLNGGLGDVVVASKNTLLFSPNSEQLAATKHANCTDWWIMTKELDNNVHHAYLLTSTGVSGPVTSTLGLSCGTISYGQGKFTPDGTKYAMAAGAAWNVQLFDFDNSTGILSNALTLASGVGFGEDVYGLSFSGDNTKLYVMRGSAGGSLYQYDISSGVPATILASATFIGSTGSYPQLQLAKDYKIYIASGGTSIGVINNPNVTGVGCGLAPASIPISGSCAIGMCNFPDSYFNETTPCLDELSAFAYGENVSCNGANDGMVWVSVSSGNEPYEYLWSPGGSTNDTLFNVGPGTYIVTVTDSVDSVSVDTIIITEPLPLNTVLNSTEDTICVGTNVTVSSALTGGTLPYSYQWSTGATDTLANVTDAPSSSGYITLDVTDQNGCTISDSVWVTVLPIPNILASPDTCLCPGSSVTLSASGTPGFIWSTGQTTANITVSPTTDTVYTVSYSNGYCSDVESIAICLHPEAFLVASNDTSIEYSIDGNQVELSAIGDAPFNWTPSTGLSCTPCANPTATLQETTTYTVTVTNAFGCTASDEVTVTVYYVLVIPNIITPNGDGFNDKFKILGLPPQSALSIFNRWGNLLFETSSYNNDWKADTDGTYYYVLKTPDGKDFSGFFHANDSK